VLIRLFKEEDVNPFRIKRNLRLATKLNFLTISFILATSIGISLFLIKMEIKNTYEELLTHGRTVIDMMAKNENPCSISLTVSGPTLILLMCPFITKENIH
jgi:nucleoside recognition membrane protein YjiH